MGEDWSLKSSVDAIDKINDIRLSLSSDAGSKIVWILVEGEDDCKIYPKFFDEAKAKVEFVNGGKGQLTVALTTLTKESPQVIGIQDADFLHLEKTYPVVDNLFFTDCHDIEMTMLSFDEVKCNLLSEYRRLDDKDSIWENVVQVASYIAYIRWYNEKNNCKIRFSGLGYGDYLTETASCKILLEKNDLLRELNTRSNNKTDELTSENIDDFIAIHPTGDLLNLCNGHDVTALFSLIIGNQVSIREFRRHLRLSFTMQCFAKTKLFSDIDNWQKEHGYAILKNIA